MKKYKIKKYINYYFKNKYIRSTDEIIANFNDIDEVKNFINNYNLNYIYNKNDISIFESLKCVIDLQVNDYISDYKIYYKYIDENLKIEVSNIDKILFFRIKA